ncbi:hypothetical protein LCGC14_2352990, partial [marine sediment metagenome]
MGINMSTVKYTNTMNYTSTTVTTSSNHPIFDPGTQQNFQIQMPFFVNKLVEDAPAKGTFPSYVSQEYLVYYSRANKDYSKKESLALG